MPLLELVRDPGLLEIMTKVLVTGQRVERRLKLAAAQEHIFEVLAVPSWPFYPRRARDPARCNRTGAAGTSP